MLRGGPKNSYQTVSKQGKELRKLRRETNRGKTIPLSFPPNPRDTLSTQCDFKIKSLWLAEILSDFIVSPLWRPRRGCCLDIQGKNLGYISHQTRLSAQGIPKVPLVIYPFTHLPPTHPSTSLSSHTSEHTFCECLPCAGSASAQAEQ